MGDIQLATAAQFLHALAAPSERVIPKLLTLLHPEAHFMTLGRMATGAEEVAYEVTSGPNGELARKLDWQPPQQVGDAVRLVGERRAGTRDRGLIMTLRFAEEAIIVVQQQRIAPPPPEAKPVALPDSLKEMVNKALVEKHPMLVAYSDPEGQPVLTFRGSVQAFSDDQLAMWIRSADGAFIQAIRQNPRLALMYRNEETKATYQFQGRARVTDQEAHRQRIFAAAPQAERAHDFAMLGVAVIVDLDRVEGYAGLGPAGQVDQVRMIRGSVAN
ncbi:MAG TPA: pyridoxamine 5'-phosphate oxidase family protein [Ramlibacter sp.]|nr:pyridoxamine 5'-phosphate oxidase family protein [Ramlibacter sp.]